MIRALAVLLLLAPAGTGQEDSLTLTLRRRTETSKGSGLWHATTKRAAWKPSETAIVVCDMWDAHWCKGATRRVGQMAPRMNEVISAARTKGVLIIHCPSGTMKAYADTVQRKLAQGAPKAEAKVPLKGWCHLDKNREAPLPIDDSDGGCDCDPKCKTRKAWSKQIDTIEIKPGDAITDSAEAYNLIRQRGIRNVIVVGVHTNMCVLGRPFSTRQLVYQGLNVVLMRDMTDTMYNSRMAPFVSHFTGTDLVVEHIEKYWAPTTTSADIIGGEEFRFPADKRPHLVMVIGEAEYRTKETLPAFARKELGTDFRVSVVHADEKNPNTFPGIEVLNEADLALISVRRRTPPKAQLDVIRKYVGSGKPLVAIRTSSHAFALRKGKPPEGHDAWPEFDNDVLGGNYHNHHGNKLKALVKTAATGRKHPIMTGVTTDEFPVHSSLYKTVPLGTSTVVLMTGRIEGVERHEPVAWTNGTKAGGRVFYTSLGHVKDFEIEAFRRLLKNGLIWAAGKTVPGFKLPQKHAGSGAMAPAAAEKSMIAFEDLEVDLVLAEPQVAQPVFLNFDERGRMWVVNYRQYPYPAGLKPISRDKHWRIVYDRMSPPPPNHFKGLDKISIHEDTDGDGAYDTHKVFLEGTNITTAVARGRGGVWVLNPPYLLFYPDANDDDVPDGDPIVHLEGFGIEDTHSVVNSLRWGPDGWLYATQGSTVMGAVKRPGDKETVNSMGQLVWRYHPEMRKYEIFAEGGGNAFGVEIDDKGRIYSGHNGGDTRGFHYVQGAYLRKGFQKHGELSNPYAYGYFPHIKHHKVPRFTHVLIIYEGNVLPEKYRGRLFGAAPLQGEIVYSEFQPEGSTFKTYDLGKPLTSEDGWFRPVDLKAGPDGAIYVADFYERRPAHRDHFQGNIDKSNGRIYRLRAKGAKALKPFDLRKKTTTDLIELLDHPNKWFRQTALRLIGDRKDRSAIPALEKKAIGSKGQAALEALWAVNLCGGLTDSLALQLMDHADPHVRLWSVRLKCDPNEVVPSIAAKLEEMAKSEKNIEVRSQLACSARRLRLEDGLPVIKALIGRSEDATDARIPLLLWWGLDTNIREKSEAVTAIFKDKEFWSLPIVRKHLLERIMRRFAQGGTRKELQACAALLNQAPDAEARAALMAGFEKAFKGRSLTLLPDELVEALAQGGGSVLLGVRRGVEKDVTQAIEQIANPKTEKTVRLQLIQAFGEVNQPSSVPALLKIARAEKNEEFRNAALTSLQRYDAESIGAEVVEMYGALPEESRAVARTLVASRSAWALRFMKAVDAGKIDARSVPIEAVRKIRLHTGQEIQALVKKHWADAEGATTEQMQKEIARLLGVLKGRSADPYQGKKLYMKTCGKCHTLFDLGGRVGPDLTPFQRDDVERMLVNVVNPSAEIREGFENHLVLTADGRRVNGFLIERDDKILVLRGADGQNIVLRAGDVERMKVTGLSIMPEGLLRPYTDQQIRDLFAYLRSAQPLND